MGRAIMPTAHCPSSSTSPPEGKNHHHFYSQYLRPVCPPPPHAHLPVHDGHCLQVCVMAGSAKSSRQVGWQVRERREREMRRGMAEGREERERGGEERRREEEKVE